MVLTSILIHKLVQENQRNPTIIYTDQNVVLSTDIYFPSISLTPGLVLKTLLETGLDYLKIKKEIKNKSIDLGNFSMNELKKMQIASLIARDGFMSQFNISIPTDDFIERMRHDFPSLWIFQKYYNFSNIPRKLYGNWSEISSMNFTEVLCPTGFCLTFNFPNDINEIFNTEK